MPKSWPKNLAYHNPVLLTEAVDWLNVQPGRKYIDATLGGGGHSREIIDRGGVVLGLDQDPEAISACPDFDNLTKVQVNFIHLAGTIRNHNWKPVWGILFDLGMSQYQIRAAHRGFSFQVSGPLDMRMNGSGVSARELVNQLSQDQLAGLLKKFGEIPMAKPLAGKIVAARPVETTDELARICGKWARQAFQAIRIAVNDELGAIEIVLPQALAELESGGRLVVISFHSLEDRIIKNQFLAWQRHNLGKVLTFKPLAGERGSKLRAFEKK